MNHTGYNVSFVMFKKGVKKFIIENDVSLSCLSCLIDIIHWMCYCNLLYSEAIVRKCSPETSGCLVVPSRYWFKYWLGAWPASSWCMGQRLLNNKRTKNKGELRHIFNIRDCIVNVSCICAQVSMCSPVVTFTGLSITARCLVDWESLVKLHVWRVSCEFGFEFEFEFEFEFKFKYDPICFFRYMIHVL